MANGLIVVVKSMKISIIIPVYNMQQYIRECLKSIVMQTIEEKEIICIDDGSTDESCKIIEEYQKSYDCIKLIHQDNQGSGAARNRGLQEAQGMYVAFMDPDDYYAGDDVLEVLVRTAEDKQMNICGGNIIKLVNGNFEKMLEEKQYFMQEGIMDFYEYQFIVGYTKFIYRKSFLDKYSIRFSRYRRSQDLHFMYKALHYAQKFYVIPKIIYVVRIIEKIQKFSEKQILDLIKGLKQILEWSYLDGYYDLYKVFWETICKYVFCSLYPLLECKGQEKWYIVDEINKNYHEKLCMQCNELYRTRLLNQNEYAQYKAEKEIYFQELKTSIKNFRTVVIYGAGSVGKRLYGILKENNIPINYFAVTVQGQVERYEDVEIHCIEDFVYQKKETLVILGCMGKNRMEITMNLKRLGFDNIFMVNEKYINIFI